MRRSWIWSGLASAVAVAVLVVADKSGEPTNPAGPAATSFLASRLVCTPTADVGFDSTRRPLVRQPGPPFIVRMATARDRKPPTIVLPQETWVAFNPGEPLPFASGKEEPFLNSTILQLSAGVYYLTIHGDTMTFSLSRNLFFADVGTIYVRLLNGEASHIIVGNCISQE